MKNWFSLILKLINLKKERNKIDKPLPRLKQNINKEKAPMTNTKND